jgi:hypothetical protein
VKRCFRIAWCLGIWILPLCAATLERLSLDEMISRSTAIVRGSVADSWTTFTGRDIYTHYRISVDERFKGPTQASVEVLVHGGVYGTYHQTPSGSPVLRKGDPYVFFLWTNSRGETWITGMTQGLFALSGDESGNSIATRGPSRELMLDPATARPVKDSAVSFKLTDLRSRIANRLGQGAAH